MSHSQPHAQPSSINRFLCLVASNVEPYDPVVAALVNLFRALRASQGLTLEQLADAARVHRTSVGLVERGERSPSVSFAARLAQALGYPLSDLLAKADLIAAGKLDLGEAFREEQARQVDHGLVRRADEFELFTGMKGSALIEAIESTYHTLDMIDDQLTSRGSVPISGLVELANLSSMLGNLLGGCLADASQGLFERNKPHHYPDLLPLREPAIPLELKVALESNRPKGHLPKPGRYITFRYVLGDRMGKYLRGKENRGLKVWVWEVRIGKVREEDFACSNTEGDSGKTAIIKSTVFYNMPLIFFDPKLCPYRLRNGQYPGFN